MAKRSIAPTTNDMHLQQVVKDRQFQQKLLNIKMIYAKKYKVSIPEDLAKLHKLYETSDDVYVHLVKDQTTKEQRFYLKWDAFEDNEIRGYVIKLAEDYAIDPLWIVGCINDPLSAPSLFDKPVVKNRAAVEEDSKSLYIRIWANTQLDDIAAAWDDIEAAKRATYFKVTTQGKWHRYKATKNKPVDDPELIYAIFRAKSENEKLTFPKIFDMYQKGTLPRYEEKPTNQFSSTKSLETYYRKYKPTT